VIKFLI